MQTNAHNRRASSLLPEVVGENRETGPDRGILGASCQHSTQTELAFEHADRRFDTAAKALQLQKPLRSLVSLFSGGQATDFRDTNFFNTRLAKGRDVLSTVVASVRRQFFRLYFEIRFGLTNQRNQFRTVAGISLVNLVVKNHPGTVLHQLQGTSKLHRLMELSFADRPRSRIIKRDNPLSDLLASKLLLGLLKNLLPQLDLFTQLLSEFNRLIRCRATKFLQNLLPMHHRVLSPGRHFLKDISALVFALLGFRPGRLTPVKQRPLGGPHMIGDLLSHRPYGAGDRLDRLVQHPHVIGITYVCLNSRRVDPYAPRLDRLCPDQLLDQVLVKPGNPIFAESMVEFDQSGRIGHFFHQRKMAEISPWKSLPHFSFSLLVAQPPAKLQIHHPQIDPYRGSRTPQRRIENLFEGLQQFRIAQMLVDLGQLLVQFVQRSINKPSPKLICCDMDLRMIIVLHHTTFHTQEISDFSSEN